MNAEEGREGSEVNPPVETSGPRPLYRFSDFWILGSGDRAFMAWQRRRLTVNRWSVVALVAMLAAIPAGWLLFQLTGNATVAVVGFVALTVLALIFRARKTWWELIGH